MIQFVPWRAENEIIFRLIDAVDMTGLKQVTEKAVKETGV
jgi:hypothetical protein